MDLKNMCMSSVLSCIRHRLAVNTCADATVTELAGVQKRTNSCRTSSNLTNVQNYFTAEKYTVVKFPTKPIYNISHNNLSNKQVAALPVEVKIKIATSYNAF